MDDKTVLQPGALWDCLPVVKVHHMVDVDQLYNQVIEMRNEWFMATNGKMEHVSVNLEMLFDDILNILTGGE